MQLKDGSRLLLLCLLALQQFDFNAGARILAPFVFPGKSHFMMTNAIIRELVKQGHEVTFVTPFSLANEKLGANYTEILIKQWPIWPTLLKLTNAKSIMDMTDMSTEEMLKMVYIMGLESTDFALEQPEFQKLVHAKDKVGKYDLLLAEQFYNEGAYILGHLYQIPIVTITTSAYHNVYDSFVGTITPWSYSPHLYKPYTEHMSLTQRINSIYTCLLEEAIRAFWYYPKQDAIMRKHFSKIMPVVPTIKQLQRNVSAILFNSYMPLESPRPLAFNTIPVGGLHIKPPKALPANIKKFLDEAKHGAVYFSLGSQVRSADLPPEKLEIFLKVFRGMKQRILWKFEDEQLPNLPANVMVQKWMPQNDILAHPNVKVFIAHGGLFGTQEAVYHGVPVLGMPFYADQYLNIEKGKNAGFTLGLDYRYITEEQLRSSLTELLENPKYMANMKRASKVFRDRPLSGMDTAMYWINYVIEHRGAPHMIAAGVDMPFYQFYMLDIVAIALALVLLPTLALCLCCCKASKNKKQKLH
ncbi:UDP-glucuronosyltransferase 2C1-like [Drosophila busckii]|uniref:UDP-glucuronosyltransferase 2C1-like n=1 Tax=Drosophila busckii TaxID=30019 RepID=UPI00083E9874|nr:UDP-glucuronosyltransferase 2C1-like [Drosophila busckii]